MTALAGRRYELALAGVLAFAAVVLWQETRDTSFVRDDWSMILYRDLSLDGLFSPHNDQVSLLPAIFWRGLILIFGIDSYTPYLVGLIAANLACGALLYTYVERRLGPAAGLAAAAVLVLLGPAWETVLWPFEICFMGSVGFGIAALLALDRGDRRGDWTAAAMIVLSIASSNAGLPFAAAAAAQVIATRVDWPLRLARVLALPLGTYVVWRAVYRDDLRAAKDAQPDQPRFLHLLEEVPRFAFDLLSNGMTAATGMPPGARGALAAALVIAVVARLLRPRPLDPAAWAALALAAAHFGGIAFTRFNIQHPETSRYLYLSVAAILLLGATLLPRPAPARRVTAVIAGLAVVVLLANLGDLRRADQLHNESTQIRAALTGLEVAREHVPPDFMPIPSVSSEIRAGVYFQAADDFGSPAYSQAELARVPDALRGVTDSVVANAVGIRFDPAAARPARPGPPELQVLANAQLRPRGRCMEVAPTAGVADVDTTARGIEVTAGPGQVELGGRRFAQNHAGGPIDTLPPQARGTVVVPADGAPGEWHLRLRSDAPFLVC